MKKLAIVILTALFVCLFFLLIGTNSKATQASQPKYSPKEYVPNEVIVKFKQDIIGDVIHSKSLIENVVSSAHGRIKTYLHQEIDMLNWDPAIFAHRSFIGDPCLFLIRIPGYISVDDAITLLQSDPRVEYAEKNGIHREQQTYPNDPYFLDLKQWGLYNTDPNNYRKDIHAVEAWDIFTGSSQVVAAVLDTGIDLLHEDLAANLWANANEIADGDDNDHNGFVDDLQGWDFVNGDNDPTDDKADDHHGTHVSGIIGAVGNNLKGISGVCWNVKIMPIKILDADGTNDDQDTVNGIDYATQNGAFLTNNSYGKKDEASYSVQAAIERALKKNRLFITAAGQDETHRDSGYDEDEKNFHWYPACYTLDNIITVLATDPSDQKCNFSCWGETSVDIGAPGIDIWSTELGTTYHKLTGTSMAAPHVAGVAALALGICPGLTSSRLKSMILGGADKVPGLGDRCVTEGRLNAYNVLNALEGTTQPNAASILTACATAWNIIQLNWHDNSNNELGFEIQRRDQYQSSFLHDNCADSNATSFVSLQDNSIDHEQERTYIYRVRAVNKAGISSFTNTASASVPLTPPDAPTDLEGPSPAVYPLVHLYWSDMAINELTYIVERRISGNGHWSVIDTLSSNSNSYTDSSARASSTYDYRVKAYNPLGYSGYSNVVTVEVISW
ncbi:MAG: S8 family serine peptidase [Candidatus Aminicenantales bacterium]